MGTDGHLRGSNRCSNLRIDARNVSYLPIYVRFPPRTGNSVRFVAFLSLTHNGHSDTALGWSHLKGYSRHNLYQLSAFVIGHLRQSIPLNFANGALGDTIDEEELPRALDLREAIAALTISPRVECAMAKLAASKISGCAMSALSISTGVK